MSQQRAERAEAITQAIDEYVKATVEHAISAARYLVYAPSTQRVDEKLGELLKALEEYL